MLTFSECTVPDELRPQLNIDSVNHGYIFDIVCEDGFSNPDSRRTCVDGNLTPSLVNSPVKCFKGERQKVKL